MMTSTVSAQHYGRQGGHYHAPHRYNNNNNNNNNNNRWVAPAIIGGIVIGGMTYALTRPTAPPPVYYPQQPVAPYGYQYVQIFDGGCNCYRWIVVPL